MTFNVDDIYEEVQKGIAESEKARNGGNQTKALWREVLKFQPNKKYVLRIIPYTNCEKSEIFAKTFFQTFQFSWVNVQTGKRTITTSARTINQPCPIQEYRRGILNNGTDAEKEEMKNKLRFSTLHSFNVYVVEDPVTPANNGTIKVVQAGSQIWNTIKDYIEGKMDEMMPNVSRKVLDLSPNGVNLVIAPHTNQMNNTDYTNGVRFVPTKADLGLDEDGIRNLMENAYDLSTVNYIRSYDEAKQYFAETYLNAAPKKTEAKAADDVEAISSVAADNVAASVAASVAAAAAKPSSPAPAAGNNTEEDMDDFIRSLSDL